MRTSLKNSANSSEDTPLYSSDQPRFRAYARDLERGLRLLRTFPQGVTVFGSARTPEGSRYYQKAFELGKLLAQNGHAVITGGGPGIMEAANRGAFEAGGRSVGLNIRLPDEQEPNAYLTDTLDFEYFFARKVMLTMSAKVYVVFPGGFGTMDELTELLVLMQERKMPRMPVFFFGKRFWRGLDRFYRRRLAGSALIDPEDLAIYRLTDSVAEIIQIANYLGHPKIDTNYYDGFHAVAGAGQTPPKPKTRPELKI